MREMAAIEALKSEKADKEVHFIDSPSHALEFVADIRGASPLVPSGICNNSLTPPEPPGTKNCASAMSVAHIFQSLTQIVVLPIILAEKYVSHLVFSNKDADAF